MTDWTDIDDSQIEAGKPGRAVDGRALRDNPVAIAEGADGAPPVYQAAMFYTGTIAALSGTSVVGSFDITGVGKLMGHCFINTGLGAASAQFSVSSDNGSSWGSWLDIASTGTGEPGAHSFTIDLVGGICLSTGVIGEGANATSTYTYTTFTAITTATNIRFRASAGTGYVSAMPVCGVKTSYPPHRHPTAPASAGFFMPGDCP